MMIPSIIPAFVHWNKQMLGVDEEHHSSDYMAEVETELNHIYFLLNVILPICSAGML